MLFMPTMHEISAVVKIAEDVPNTVPLEFHARIFKEAISVLTWPVVEDITPLNYVVDLDTSLRIYFEKFQIYYANHEGGQIHVTWMNAMKRFLRDIRFYIQTHHENALEFGLGHAEGEIPDALKKRELKYQVDHLKKKNEGKVKHFKLGEKKGPMYGKRTN